MFRSIRRKKKEISTEDTKKLLCTERRGILAMNGEDGYPYAVPINFLYSEKENKICFHGARAGYKTDLLKQNEKICFTVYGNERIGEEKWAPFVQSAVIFGRCRLIEDPIQSGEKLREFAKKYYPDNNLIEEVITSFGKVTQMYEIEIEHLSGKEIQEK